LAGTRDGLPGSEVALGYGAAELARHHLAVLLGPLGPFAGEAIGSFESRAGHRQPRSRPRAVARGERGCDARLAHHRLRKERPLAPCAVTEPVDTSRRALKRPGGKHGE